MMFCMIIFILHSFMQAYIKAGVKITGKWSPFQRITCMPTEMINHNIRKQGAHYIKRRCDTNVSCKQGKNGGLSPSLISHSRKLCCLLHGLLRCPQMAIVFMKVTKQLVLKNDGFMPLFLKNDSCIHPFKNKMMVQSRRFFHSFF